MLTLCCEPEIQSKGVMPGLDNKASPRAEEREEDLRQLWRAGRNLIVDTRL